VDFNMSGSVQLPSFEALGATDVAALKLQNAGATTLAAGLTTFGQVFEQGTLSAGGELVARIGLANVAVQVDVKSTWEDGSVKMAVLTLARPALAAGTDIDVILTRAEAAPWSARIASAVPDAVDLDAAIAKHSFSVALTLQGKATQNIDVLAALHDAIKSGTASYWQEGPLATQARVEIPVSGSLRLVFDVTAWKNGEISIEAQFNNDIAMTASGGTVSYSAVMRLDGAVVGNETVTQAQYQNWHQSYASTAVDGGQGLGSSAAGWLNIQHDIGALQNTGAIAAYDLSIGINTSLLNSWQSATKSASWDDPLAANGVTQFMPMSGGRSDIGFVTQGNTGWLMTQDARAAAYAMGQAEAAGSVPWHFWNDAKDTWLNTDSYPNLWTDARGGTGRAAVSSSTGLTQQVSGSTGWTPDTSHQPELSFVPYLLTGERWMLDNLNAQASAAVMATYPDARQYGADLVVRWQEVRAAAWNLREVENAAFASPDGSAEQAFFRSVADANWAWLVSNIPQWTAEQGEAYGWLPGEYGIAGALPPWQQDYMASTAIAAAKRGSEDALTFLKWQANFLVGRFTHESSGFNPRDGAAYIIAIDNPTSGSAYKTWAEIGKQTVAAGYSNGSGWSASDGNYVQVALATLAGIYDLTGMKAAADAYWKLLALNPPYVSEATFAGDPIYGLDAPPGGGVVKSAGAAAATLVGGRGDDTLNGGAAADTLTGGSGQDRLVGNGGNDSIVGGTGADSLWGATGNDTLDGGTGDDWMVGGAGNDVFYVDSPRDVVREAAGQGDDLVIASSSFTLGANIERLTLVGSGNHRGVGNGLDNVLTGAGQNDILLGRGGDDTIIGGNGADSMIGGIGADSMVGGAGNDFYWVDSALDKVIEAASGGIDRVISTISYTLPVNVENLTLSGTGRMTGTGNAADNQIVGNGGVSVLYGMDGNDALWGGAGADTLYGGAGADRLNGQAGNDVLVGGAGADTLSGGDGADRFRFEAASEFGDRITDFQHGIDHLEFSRAALGNLLPAGDLAAGFFAKGTVATGAGAKLLYDSASGVVRWDADGAGGAAPVVVATLTGSPTLTADDIFITA
jgi:Ca2+-binding RTX toxin-like protein